MFVLRFCLTFGVSNEARLLRHPESVWGYKSLFHIISQGVWRMHLYPSKMKISVAYQRKLGTCESKFVLKPKSLRTCLKRMLCSVSKVILSFTPQPWNKNYASVLHQLKKGFVKSKKSCDVSKWCNKVSRILKL